MFDLPTSEVLVYRMPDAKHILIRHLCEIVPYHIGVCLEASQTSECSISDGYTPSQAR